MKKRITNHAYRRAKERIGLSKNGLNRLVSKVRKHGVKSENCIDELKTYIYHKSKRYKNSYCKIYHKFIFIFSKSHVLITIYPISDNILDEIIIY